MQTAKGKLVRAIRRSRAEGNGKNASFRDLRAFAMWRNRADLKDPVQFTNELRARMERSKVTARPGHPLGAVWIVPGGPTG
jgi:hypothetical protein